MEPLLSTHFLSLQGSIHCTVYLYLAAQLLHCYREIFMSTFTAIKSDVTKFKPMREIYCILSAICRHFFDVKLVLIKLGYSFIDESS